MSNNGVYVGQNSKLHPKMFKAVGYYIIFEESPNHVFYAWGYKEDPSDLFPTHQIGWGCNVYGWGDSREEALGNMVINTVMHTPSSYYFQEKK